VSEEVSRYAIVPVQGEWRVSTVGGSDELGWIGTCHPVLAWAIDPDAPYLAPLPVLAGEYDPVQDRLSEAHLREEWCRDRGDHDALLAGGGRVGITPMCSGLDFMLSSERYLELRRREEGIA
jgi:hypothetical protein